MSISRTFGVETSEDVAAVSSPLLATVSIAITIAVPLLAACQGEDRVWHPGRRDDARSQRCRPLKGMSPALTPISASGRPESTSTGWRCETRRTTWSEADRLAIAARVARSEVTVFEPPDRLATAELVVVVHRDDLVAAPS